MVSLESVLGVAIIALGIVLSPGPNMVYLVSRTLSQGRRAGYLGLAGVGLGLLCYMIAAALGLGAIFDVVPELYAIIKTCGALYLGYLAWQMVSQKTTPLDLDAASTNPEPKPEPKHSDRNLFVMGLITNLLNPKIALLYAALIPQFIQPENGAVFTQFLILGCCQIAIALTVNGLIVLTAAKLGAIDWLRDDSTQGFWSRSTLQRLERWISASLLGFFAIKMLLSKRPAV